VEWIACNGLKQCTTYETSAKSNMMKIEHPSVGYEKLSLLKCSNEHNHQLKVTIYKLVMNKRNMFEHCIIWSSCIPCQP